MQRWLAPLLVALVALATFTAITVYRMGDKLLELPPMVEIEPGTEPLETMRSEEFCTDVYCQSTMSWVTVCAPTPQRLINAVTAMLQACSTSSPEMRELIEASRKAAEADGVPAPQRRDPK